MFNAESNFLPNIDYAEGILRTVAWFDAHPGSQGVDAEANDLWYRLVATYLAGLDQARWVFAPGRK